MRIYKKYESFMEAEEVLVLLDTCESHRFTIIENGRILSVYPDETRLTCFRLCLNYETI